MGPHPFSQGTGKCCQPQNASLPPQKPRRDNARGVLGADRAPQSSPIRSRASSARCSPLSQPGHPSRADNSPGPAGRDPRTAQGAVTPPRVAPAPGGTAGSENGSGQPRGDTESTPEGTPRPGGDTRRDIRSWKEHGGHPRSWRGHPVPGATREGTSGPRRKTGATREGTAGASSDTGATRKGTPRPGTPSRRSNNGGHSGRSPAPGNGTDGTKKDPRSWKEHRGH